MDEDIFNKYCSDYSNEYQENKMPLEKVKISNPKITDSDGQYGPSKSIRFTQYLPEGNRNLSGFVKPHLFKADDWKDGAVIELEVFKKGTYWNFKLPTATSKQAAQPAQESQTQKDILSCLLRIESLLTKKTISENKVKEFFGVTEDEAPFPEEAPY